MNEFEMKIATLPNEKICAIYLDEARVAYFKGQDGITQFIDYYEYEAGNPEYRFLAIMKGSSVFMRIPIAKCRIEMEVK